MLRLACVVVAAIATSGCGGQSTDDPRGVAERFYAAVARDEGSRACAQLSPDLVTEIEDQEMKPCEKAVLTLELEGSRARSAEAYIETAAVEMDSGDRVFLDETPDGWRIAALGCRTEPGEEAPQDCEAET